MSRGNGEFDTSRIPVEGVAGLGLAVTAAVVVYSLAPLRSLVVPVLLGATIVGLTLLAWRHRETRSWAIAGLSLAVLAGLLVALGRVMQLG